MTVSNIKAIVWDLDGTLIHFNIDWLRARREAIKILKRHGIPKHILTVKSSILENIKLAREYFATTGYDAENTEKSHKPCTSITG